VDDGGNGSTIEQLCWIVHRPLFCLCAHSTSRVVERAEWQRSRLQWPRPASSRCGSARFLPVLPVLEHAVASSYCLWKQFRTTCHSSTSGYSAWPSSVHWQARYDVYATKVTRNVVSYSSNQTTKPGNELESIALTWPLVAYGGNVDVENIKKWKIIDKREIW